jgi:RimJ/RimL family protein N-acetyltransferase
MERLTIPAGWLTLRPFTTADTGWVYDVSQDPAVQHYVQVPSPYRMEHAAFFVHQVAMASWDSGQRAEFLAEDTATGARLGRVGLGLSQPGTAEIGYWTDPSARHRGVATTAVRAACRWAFITLGTELIEWRCEVGNTASRRVAEKAGFLIEATLRKRLIHRGIRVDAWVGSILGTELTSAPLLTPARSEHAAQQLAPVTSLSPHWPRRSPGPARPRATSRRAPRGRAPGNSMVAAYYRFFTVGCGNHWYRAALRDRACGAAGACGPAGTSGA